MLWTDVTICVAASAAATETATNRLQYDSLVIIIDFLPLRCLPFECVGVMVCNKNKTDFDARFFLLLLNATRENE